MKTVARDLRSELRRKADGDVRVWFSSPQAVEIAGRLVDVSDNGFRMAHGSMDLAAGQMVEFSHGEASGQAQVMWNRIVNGRVETGLRIVRAR